MGGSRQGGSDSYLRRIAPFLVVDEEGRPYDHPFLGGYNMPRPQLVDIDADGDLDLFLQEESGRLVHFERIEGSTPTYRWRSDAYEALDVGEWFRFVDMDRDGDPDLLAEERYSHIRYYRNEGTASRPRFALAVDTLRAVDGTPLFSDRQNIPNAVDIDCDDALDLMIGRLDGTITRYREEGIDPSGAPRFRLITERFEEIEIVAQIGSAHGANTMALGDVDMDGDVDLLWGDFFEPGLLLVENRGSCATPMFRTEPRPFPLDEPLRTSGYNAPTLGDLDGDGDADLLVGVLGGAYNPNTTQIDNLHHLEQVGPSVFRHRTSRFISMVDVGSESVPRLVDLDRDGDLDLVVGNRIEPGDPTTGALRLFRNTGTPRLPTFRLEGTLPFPGSGYHPIPAFGDLDGDGVLDAVVGRWTDELHIYRGVADEPHLSFVPADLPPVSLTRGRNAAPTLGDLDGDGDLDLLIGESAGTLSLYLNSGGRRAPRFELADEAFAGIDVGRRSIPVLYDLDGDGDLDLVVGSEAAGVQVYRNQGTRTNPAFTPEGALPIDPWGVVAPAFGDLDGDGDADLLLGGIGGGVRYYERGGG